MGKLEEHFSRDQLAGYINVDELDLDVCVELMHELKYLITIIDRYHRHNLNHEDYILHFRTKPDINEMWRSAMKARTVIENSGKQMQKKIPVDFLEGGKYSIHPSMWTFKY